MINPKTILITGGTGKIGLQLVQHFLQKGFRVLFTSRNKKNIASLVKQLSCDSHQNHLYGIPVDLEKEDSSKQIIDFSTKNNIWPDTLINNARNLDHLKLKHNAMPGRDAWLGEFLLDVVVPYELSMTLAYHKDSKIENIVNIASMYGIVPSNPNLYKNPELESPIHYGVAKAALIHLTKELAIRLAGKGIQVNSIAYGGVEGRVTDDFKARYAKLCPSGRMLKEEEVIGAADFLISDKSIGITGHNLVVDGGWTVW